MVTLRQRSSSIKNKLPSEVVFNRRLPSIKGCLPIKVIFHLRLSNCLFAFCSHVVSSLQVNFRWGFLLFLPNKSTVNFYCQPRIKPRTEVGIHCYLSPSIKEAFKLWQTCWLFEYFAPSTTIATIILKKTWPSVSNSSLSFDLYILS